MATKITNEKIYSVRGLFGPHDSLSYKFAYETHGSFRFQIELAKPANFLPHQKLEQTIGVSRGSS